MMHRADGDVTEPGLGSFHQIDLLVRQTWIKRKSVAVAFFPQKFKSKNIGQQLNR